MSNIDEILRTLVIQNTPMDYETSESLESRKEAKDQLYKDMLEVIGEDGETNGYLRPNGTPSVDLTESYYNELKTEQKKRLAQYFGKDNR